MQKQRIVLIDELRGFAAVQMVLYHFVFDLAVFAGWNIPIGSKGIRIWQNAIGITFIVLSGLVCSFSRSNLKRGIKLFFVALGLSLVTYLFVPGMTIWFGVLHLLSLAMILYHFLQPLFAKIGGFTGIAGFLLLFCVSFSVRDGFLWLFVTKISLPEFLYQNLLGAVLGFAPQGFSSGDYYPLIPWVFLFFAGACLGQRIKNRKLPDWAYQTHLSPLAFLGRHSLVLYLVHQPVLYGIVYLIGR